MKSRRHWVLQRFTGARTYRAAEKVSEKVSDDL